MRAMEIINQSTETVALDALRPHPRNPRQGDIGAIHESIRANGFYGQVVAQKSTGYILAGNHRWRAAAQAGATEIPVTWVDVDDDRALRILLADNRTNDLASYDDEALALLLKELADGAGLGGTGYDGDDLDHLLAGLDAGSVYSRKIEAPIYRPTGPKPRLADLVDCSRYEKLVADIHAAELPEGEKTFLLLAATRHIVFNYRNIAEYYAHSDAVAKALFEDSALVIIDFKRAIELGYARLASELQELFEGEHGTG